MKTIIFILLSFTGFSQVRFNSGLTYDDLETFHVITFVDYKTKLKEQIIFRDKKAFLNVAFEAFEKGRTEVDGVVFIKSDNDLVLMYKGNATIVTRYELEAIRND